MKTKIFLDRQKRVANDRKISKWQRAERSENCEAATWLERKAGEHACGKEI